MPDPTGLRRQTVVLIPTAVPCRTRRKGERMALASPNRSEPMSEARIIKKYPNRRLYDTAISSYITLEDVKRLVLERADFRVVDARSSDDITRGILLQIISEQEEQGNPIFTTEVLAHIIRFYGDTLQGMMGNYLEKSLQAFVDQQHLVREQLRNLMGSNPLQVISDLAELLGLRQPGALAKLIEAAGLTVARTHTTKPKHGKSKDRADPLHAARSKETTTLYELVRR